MKARSTQHSLSLISLVVFALLAVALFAACGSDDASPPSPTAFVPLATATPTAPSQHGPTDSSPTEAPTVAPTTVPTTAPPVGQGQSRDEGQSRGQEQEQAPPDDGPPGQGDWIDVNVSNYTVSLMQGTAAVQVIGPVAVGEQIDTGVYESTQTGLFHVYSMDAALTYDAPYDTYISDWVGFDPNLANGFHSFLKDADGNVVDASTGNISNGCIRTPDPEAIYNFAAIGMPVYVHY
jgi:hypothetical protein